MPDCLTLDLERWLVRVSASVTYSATVAVSTSQPPMRAPSRERRESRAARWGRNRQAVQANVRARRLLVSLLSPEALLRYEASGDVPVTGSGGGQYLIRPGYTGNVVRTWTDDAGRSRREVLCAHPDMVTDDGGRLPVYDAHAAQFLMLRTDEPGFRRLANIEPG